MAYVEMFMYDLQAMKDQPLTATVRLTDMQLIRTETVFITQIIVEILQIGDLSNSLLLVTTPSRRMIFGWLNWPMIEASHRKSRLCCSV